MRIAIIGAGFTGLTAALQLAKKGHQITVFESSSNPGGLAGSFKLKDWNWSLEKAYHHFFTNDKSALNLAKEVNQKIIIRTPKTDVYVQDDLLPFDSPLALLKFPYLPFIDKLRVGLVIFYLRNLSNLSDLKSQTALPWLKKYMGEKATNLIWEPLFKGKFGEYQNTISLTWFWARIKKRTASLAYPEGGFGSFADKIKSEAEKNGAKFIFNSEVSDIIKLDFDKILVTIPTSIFTKIAKLPANYIKRLNSIKHLSALVLVLVFKKPFFKGKTYWLNITDKNFPFLVMAEHTNFMDKKNYGNQHILYIGNYLPENHPYLKMSAKELLKIFEPYLKKINPSYQLSAISHKLFSLPNAQPIVATKYPQQILTFQTPLKNIYLANMDMVYPWDRGVNYAVEMGEKAAEIIEKNK
ncbi:MAG: FAD-dependent oxidoreductase [Candidatus Daviesbacteria bacterium]|nr:FAD-dependent oxidoreductase [Candidatus Daviesbacteria bacterium]